MATEDFKRKLTAILSADAVGYSRLMGDNETDTVKTLETYKGVMFSLIRQHRGRVVDSPGDNLLAEFGSVVDAVQCAVSIQKEFQARNADLQENRRMEFRIGINLGDVIEEQDHIYGDGVNIAARLEALADPGGICVSKTAFDHIESKLPLGYEFLGDQTVKNITKPIGAYRVLMEPRVSSIKLVDKKKAILFWRKKSILSVGIIVILVIVAGLYWDFRLSAPSIEPASIERMAYPLPDKPSIAVLPFTNMSGDPSQEYIGDGLSEIIRNALSVSSHLFVMNRNATIVYKGTPIKPQKVAEDLGVQYILDGSIHKTGNQLRVAAQLIDALNGHQLWSNVYDREMKNLFDLQDEITKKIMVSLQVELSGSEDVRIYAKSTDNLEAWKHYIKGIELYSNLNAKDNLLAREQFESAIEIDPSFVAALSCLAQTHIEDFIFEWGDSQITSMNQAIELANKAVKLDEQDPSAHAILGLVFLYQNELEKAITEGKRAITLNPNYAYGYVILAYTMHYSGLFDEAITLSKKAYRLHPIFISLNLYVMANSYILKERYEEAIEVLRQMEKHVLPGSRAEVLTKAAFSRVYQELGKEEEARAYMAKALEIKPDYFLDNFANEPYKDPAHLKRVLDTLRKAGMPEKPPGAVQEKPSIAVLPFGNLSSDPEQEYFVAGLSEEILNSLAQIPDITVIAKTSSFSYKGTNKKIQEISNELGVNHILEGSVRKAGNALRITAQLIKSDDSSHLWSETYDRKLDDIFKIQEDIANNVAEKLKLTLGIDKSPIQLGGTDNLKAYELYLIARGKVQENDDIPAYKSALELLDAALVLDPQFALAWQYKSRMHLLLNLTGPAMRSKDEADASLKAALKAIELEPNLGDTYINIGWIEMSKSEWSEAERNYRKALELINKSLSGDHTEILPFYISVGKITKAKELIDKMRKNDPINQGFLSWYYDIYGALGYRQRAEKEYLSRKKTMLKSESNSHDEAITLARLGSGDKLSPDEIVSPDAITKKVKKYYNSPEKALAELHRIFSSDNNLSTYNLSIVSIWAAYLGDPEFALDALEKGSETSTNLVSCWYPVMTKIRQLPRFKEFVKEINLVDYWKEYGWSDLCHPVGDDDFVCE